MTSGTLLPPKPPVPGSDEDARRLRLLSNDASRLSVVRKLREDAWRMGLIEDETIGAKPNATPPPLTQIYKRAEEGKVARGEKEGVDNVPDWMELTVSPPEANSLTAQMVGYGGIGVQKAFWSDKHQELRLIVWFGASLGGWPGLAHGGAIATLLIEGTRMAAVKISGKEPQSTYTVSIAA